LLVVGVVACGPSPAARPDATPIDGPPCDPRCSADLLTVRDCNDNVVTACDGVTVCDPGMAACVDACGAAEQNGSSIGCDYYATSMDVFQHGNCFAAFVANTWPAPAHLTVRRGGTELPVASFARIPAGSGPGLTFEPYDPVAGVPPGQVAILFLGGETGAAPKCPLPSAVAVSSFEGTGIGESFQITTDVPVVAYQINPFGGGAGQVAITGASLLLPTSVWDVTYLAVNGAEQGDSLTDSVLPSLNIIAREDGTIATIQPGPTTAIVGGNGIPAGEVGQPVSINLAKGQFAQITQVAELTGSRVTANKPIGFMAGHQCMDVPFAASFCDHAEQMIPPVKALGSTYVGVMYRPRVAAETSTFWRVIGAVDGTQLAYSSDVGGPATLARGEAVTFQTGTPFIVSSQDSEHPFMLFTYMSSSSHVEVGFGDPDFVLAVPPAQYLDRYVFFTDPTYPETNLVVIRTIGADGLFHDVSLDCLGVIEGWQPIDTSFEFARIDLVTGNFMNVGACSTGRREISSTAPFGLTVWGWGTPITTPTTRFVSYGYPGGMNVQPLNNVIF
jgi:hypothetical protein